MHGQLGKDLLLVTLRVHGVDILEKDGVHRIGNGLRDVERHQFRVGIHGALSVDSGESAVDSGVKGVGLNAKSLSSAHKSGRKLDILRSDTDGVDSDIDVTVGSVTLLASDRIFEMFNLLEVLAHVIVVPRIIAQQITEVVEIVLARKQADQGVMLRAATKATVARVEGTKNGRALGGVDTT